MKTCLLLFAYIFVSFAIPHVPRSKSQSDVSGDSQLTLSETASISVPTTYTQVSLSITVKQNFGSGNQDQVIQDVMNQASNTTTDVSTYVQEQTVTKFHTTGISLSPITRWDNTAGISTDIGYQATNSVSFQVKNADAGDVIAGAVRIGGSYVSIDSVNFVACDDDIKAGQQKAVKNALLAATTQGEFVLETLGLCHDHLASINVVKGTPTGPIPLAYAAKSFAAEASSVSVPVSGGTQDVSATATLVIAYKEC